MNTLSRRLVTWSLSLLLPLSAAVEANVSQQEARDIAREAYIYAYPMVLMQITRDVSTNVEKVGSLTAPVNQLSHARATPDHRFTIVVRPNADTLYSAIQYDVSEEPLVFEVPDAGDRYYLIEFLDYWTDVFTVPGTRTTGNDAQTFAIVGPDWNGDLPEGVREYRSPTNNGLMITRVQIDGPEDLEEVHAFQDGMSVYPLSAYGRDYTPPLGKVRPGQDNTAPPVQIAKMPADQFFELFAELMKENPPHANDYPLLDRLARIGIHPGESFDFESAPEVVQSALEKAPASALPTIKQGLQGATHQVNGWQTRLTAMGTYGADYLSRARVAYGGLGANVVEDAVYPAVYVDEDGDTLQSDRNYVLHFPEGSLPPAKAFWSLAMYDERQLFTDNPINRYSIGDRDDLQFNEDGSLTLYIQRESPGKSKESNWLPTPAEGDFSMLLRIYWPEREVLEGRWNPPPVSKAD